MPKYYLAYASILLLARFTARGVAQSDVWSYVGGTLTTGVPFNSTHPNSRQGIQAFVPEQNKSLAYVFGGGVDGSNYYSSTWRFNLTSSRWAWVHGSNATNQAGSIGNPSPRAFYAMCGAHPNDNSSFVIMGGFGFTQSGTNTGYLGDFYTFNTTTSTWRYTGGLNDTTNAPHFPPGRQMAACWTLPSQYRDAVFIFGGDNAAGTLADGWMLNVTTRRFRFLFGKNGTNTDGLIGGVVRFPGSRKGPSIFTIPNRPGRAYLFGGSLNFLFYGDTWEFDLRNLSNPTIRFVFGYNATNTANVNPVTGFASYPGARSGASMVTLDNTSVVMFGGFGYSASWQTAPTAAYLQDIWIFNMSRKAGEEATWVGGTNMSGISTFSFADRLVAHPRSDAAIFLNRTRNSTRYFTLNIYGGIGIDRAFQNTGALGSHYSVDVFMTPCQAGEYYNAVLADCTPCPQDTYSDSVMMQACTPCFSGKTTNGLTGGKSQQECGCPPGTYDYGWGGCSPCPFDMYNPTWQAGVFSCQSCPDNTTTFGLSSPASCICKAGYFNDGNGYCTPCPQSTYKPTAGNGTIADCASCPDNYISELGSTSNFECYFKFDCGRGMYLDIATDKCTVCPEGTYKDTTGNLTWCNACFMNRTTLGTTAADHDDATDCLCPPGFEIGGGGGCVACLTGFAKDKWSTGMCTYCSFPTYPNEDSTGCTSCLPGYEPFGNASCRPCPVDTFKDTPGSDACAACDASNSFTNGNTGQTSCMCKAGYYRDINGCMPCPDNTYKSWNGDGGYASCLSCPNGRVAQPGSSECWTSNSTRYCGPGKQFNATDKLCYECLVNFYQPLEDTNDACRACPSNMATPTKGSQYCQCDVNYYRDASGNCVSCELGYGKNTVSNSSCIFGLTTSGSNNTTVQGNATLNTTTIFALSALGGFTVLMALVLVVGKVYFYIKRRNEPKIVDRRKSLAPKASEKELREKEEKSRKHAASISKAIAKNSTLTKALAESAKENLGKADDPSKKNTSEKGGSDKTRVVSKQPSVVTVQDAKNKGKEKETPKGQGSPSAPASPAKQPSNFIATELMGPGTTPPVKQQSGFVDVQLLAAPEKQKDRRVSAKPPNLIEADARALSPDALVGKVPPSLPQSGLYTGPLSPTPPVKPPANFIDEEMLSSGLSLGSHQNQLLPSPKTEGAATPSYQQAPGNVALSAHVSSPMAASPSPEVRPVVMPQLQIPQVDAMLPSNVQHQHQMLQHQQQQQLLYQQQLQHQQQQPLLQHQQHQQQQPLLQHQQQQQQKQPQLQPQLQQQQQEQQQPQLQQQQLQQHVQQQVRQQVQQQQDHQPQLQQLQPPIQQLQFQQQQMLQQQHVVPQPAHDAPKKKKKKEKSNDAEAPGASVLDSERLNAGAMKSLTPGSAIQDTKTKNQANLAQDSAATVNPNDSANAGPTQSLSPALPSPSPVTPTPPMTSSAGVTASTLRKKRLKDKVENSRSSADSPPVGTHNDDSFERVPAPQVVLSVTSSVVSLSELPPLPNEPVHDGQKKKRKGKKKTNNGTMDAAAAQPPLPPTHQPSSAAVIDIRDDSFVEMVEPKGTEASDAKDGPKVVAQETVPANLIIDVRGNSFIDNPVIVQSSPKTAPKDENMKKELSDGDGAANTVSASDAKMPDLSMSVPQLHTTAASIKVPIDLQLSVPRLDLNSPTPSKPSSGTPSEEIMSVKGQ